FTISSSESRKGTFSSRASAVPTAVLPAPIMPTITTVFFSRIPTPHSPFPGGRALPIPAGPALNGVKSPEMPYIFGGRPRLHSPRGWWRQAGQERHKNKGRRAYGADHQGGIFAGCAWVSGSDGLCLPRGPAACAGGDTQTRGAGCGLTAGSGR